MSATPPPSLIVDWEAYLPYLEDQAIHEDQKRELIETLLSIVIACVDLGFGLHPAQQACGEDSHDNRGIGADMLSCLLTSSNSEEEAPATGATRDAGGKESPHAS
jgi:hypothetical protein